MTPDPAGFSDGPNLYAYVHNSPLILVDPYGLTALDDAEEIGQDTAMGALQGFVHPIDTMWNNAGYASDFAREAYHGDFSRVTNASGVDIARFVGARAGEAVGATVSVGLSLEMVNAAYKIGCAGISYAKGAFGSLAQSFVRKESAALGVEGSAFAAGERKAGQFLTGNAARADYAADVSARGVSAEAVREPGTATSEWVNLASEKRTAHILEGETRIRCGEKVYSGGHIFPGLPGKTPFPEGWGRDKIMHHISDVATDPHIPYMPARGSCVEAIGVRENVKIKVVINRNGEIVTGHPIP